MTGGAGRQHSASGGSASAPRSCGVRLPGRCTIQMWSRESTATPTTLPSVQLSGSGFGHVGSNAKLGAPSAPAWEAAAPAGEPDSAEAPAPSAAPTAHNSSP